MPNSETTASEKDIVEILVVSRDMMEIHTLKKFLAVQDQEFHVNQAKDGIEALDFLEQKGEFTNVPQPNLIIINPNLPKLSGYQVLQKLDRNPKLKDIPRITIDKNTSPISENLSPTLSPFFYVVEAYTKKQRLDSLT